MQVYKSKYSKLPGTSYPEVVKRVRREYHAIQKKTPRRQPYIRSKYFTRDKVFINEFWNHLESKSWADRLRRLKLFPCAIDLLMNTTVSPEVTQKAHRSGEVFYRFSGQTADGQFYYVQVRQNSKGRKDFISVFPAEKQKAFR